MEWMRRYYDSEAGQEKQIDSASGVFIGILIGISFAYAIWQVFIR
jgi:preprotein translocase subunit Sec61beta